MKHEKQDKHNDNYSNVQEFSDKLIPLSDMIILKNKKTKKKHTKKLNKITSYVINMVTNSIKYAQFT